MPVPTNDIANSNPATLAAAATLSDSVDITAFTVRALWVGGAGSIVAIPRGGTAAVTFAGIQAGTILPIAVSRIYATGTTATSIVMLG